MEIRCIYCGENKGLTESDIMPDALTNRRITNNNVCGTKHNNKFSDLFEDEVIKKLAYITNKLSIKSSKAKGYVSYPTEIEIDGITFEKNVMDDEGALLRTMRSKDEEYLYGPVSTLEKMQSFNKNELILIDVNHLEASQRIKTDISIFFSLSIKRLAAKIAFEWYCKLNSINNKLQEFESIIQFITEGIGDESVKILDNELLYDRIMEISDSWSHTLLSYIGLDGSVNIIVSLFGIAIYNVKLCDSAIDSSINIAFQELTIDSRSLSFEFDTIKDLINVICKKRITLPIEGKRIIIFVDRKSEYYLFYLNNIDLFQTILISAEEKVEKIVPILNQKLVQLSMSQPFTKKWLKRNVKKYFSNNDKVIELNPDVNNKNEILFFYCVFVLGLNFKEVKTFDDLKEYIQNILPRGDNTLTEKELVDMHKRILSESNYSEILKRGAEIVESWDA